MVNMDKTRLPGTRLEALVARINHRDSFHAGKVGESLTLSASGLEEGHDARHHESLVCSTSA